MLKKYLLLYPNTFLWCSDKNGLIYNAQKGCSYYFLLNDNIRNVCEELSNPNSLYKCIIHDSEAIIISDWLNRILELDMGELIQLEENDTPLSFPPILNLQSDIARLELAKGRDIGENILSYITDVDIYLGGICDTNNSYAKQFLYPISNEEILHPDLIENVIISLKKHPIRLNIIGGDLVNYPYYKLLFDLIDNSCFYLSFCIFDYLFVPFFYLLEKKENITFKIICTNYDSFLEIQKFIADECGNKLGFLYSWIFLATSEDDINNLNHLLEKKYVNKFEVYPLYTGYNKYFFEKNVYIDEPFFENPNISKKSIFRNSVINSNFWGKIIIMSDAKIYSNLNFPSIGNVYDSIYEILIRELKMKNSWRLLRAESFPCKDCLYKYICSPISNYELVLGSYDLCLNKYRSVE